MKVKAKAFLCPPFCTILTMERIQTYCGKLGWSLLLSLLPNAASIIIYVRLSIDLKLQVQEKWSVSVPPDTLSKQLSTAIINCNSSPARDGALVAGSSSLYHAGIFNDLDHVQAYASSHCCCKFMCATLMACQQMVFQGASSHPLALTTLLASLPWSLSLGTCGWYTCSSPAKLLMVAFSALGVMQLYTNHYPFSKNWVWPRLGAAQAYGYKHRHLEGIWQHDHVEKQQ